jgi:hypothetical protein
MPATEAPGRSEASQNFHRLWPWLAYAVGLLLREAGYGDAGAVVFMLGMLGHRRFWLLMVGCAAIGYWLGGRRRERACRT